MKYWKFRSPKKIVFGIGSIESSGYEINRIAKGRILIITDSVIIKEGILGKLLSELDRYDLKYEIYDNVNGEPTDAHVRESLNLYKESNCSAIVAIGGGSPIDTAKAVSAMAANPGEISDYMGLEKIIKKGPPIVAIPTTAGTGSEATPVTIITDIRTNVKMLIISEYIIPDIAIVDPILIISCPPALTAAVGIDALTHAIEAYVSLKANPVTDMFALKAVNLIFLHLLEAYHNGKNLNAREKVMLGSNMAGIAFGNSSVALVHGMSRPIGANFHVPHGVSNAALLSVVMEYSYMANPDRYADIASAMGINITGMEKIEASKTCLESVKKLIYDLNIPALKDLGIKLDKLKELAPIMAQAAIDSGSPANNPKIATKEEIINLYMKAY